MLGSVVLDVAIGMAFVFLLLSLLASTIQEFLATLVQARSANLFRGLLSLFSGGTFEDGVSFVERIYNHGLVQGLYRGSTDFNFANSGKALSTRTAVWRPSLLRRLLVKFLRVEPVTQLSWLPNPDLLPSYIPARTFALALIDLLNETRPDGSKLIGREAAANVRSILLRMTGKDPRNKAVEALLTLAIDAGDNLSKLQANFENWYSDAMDRVSGWYKKNTQYLLLAIGLLLAIAFNVNAIAVGQALWFDRDVRQSMVDAARKINEQGPAEVPGQSSAGIPALQQRLQADVEAFHNASAPLLPVGWSHSPASVLLGDPGLRTQRRILNFLAVVSGWLITAAAISLGAPFWFDLLNRFMVVRNTVKPQEKSQTEASKDPTPDSKP